MNVVKAMQHPDTPNDCMSIDIINSLVKEVNMTESLESELEDIFKDVHPDLEESERIIEPLKIPQEEEKPPKPELKPLPPSLKYAFLGEGDTFPVIMSSALNPQEEEALIQVLRTHKTALGWSISDLKGISLAKYMHKILLEDDAKLVVQPQRRLNPAIKEVV